MSHLSPDRDNNSAPDDAGSIPTGREAGSPVNADLDDIHRQTEEMVSQAIRAERSVLIESPPSSGKTTSVLKIASDSDRRFTYLTKRQDLYDQAETLSAEYGATPTIIPSPHRDCPSFDPASPHHDPDAVDLYKLGIRAGPLHDLLDLTCRPDCPYVQFWEDFDAAEHDLLVGHYKHAYITSVVEDRTVIIDEFPGDAFEREFEDAPRMIGRFLKTVDGVPFSNWDDIIEHRLELDRFWQALEWFSRNGFETPADTIIHAAKGSRYHRLAPLLVYSLLVEGSHDTGFGFPWLNLTDRKSDHPPGSDGLRRVAINHTDHTIHLLTQPDLCNASGIVGLDGTPLPEQWELVTGEDFDHRCLLGSGQEMNAYIHDTLGVTIKQANKHLKPYHSGHITANRDEAVLYGVEVAEGQIPALIAPKKALDAYSDAGVLDRVKTSMNYAEVLSSNAFTGEAVGVIHGAPHPGDDTLKRWAAYFGAQIEGDGEGMEKTYGDFGDKFYQHFVHNQVLQAILRFGRGESDATVYVNTAAIPDWLDIDSTVRVELFNSESKRVIADHLRQQGDDGGTIKSIQDDTDFSENTVRRRLTDFKRASLVDAEDNPGPYPTVYRWSV